MSTPFIINLTKTHQGYVFSSIEESAAGNRSKKPRPPPLKNTNSKITNRLIKQIGLISDIPIIQEESLPPKQNTYAQQQQMRQQIQNLQEEEEIDCEIKRSNSLPECPAKWFSTKHIHAVQIESFPQFHDGRSYKTPTLYQSYRNFLVEAYERNPKRYLTFIACRRVLRGDVNCLLKIFRFLEKEGIINYCLAPEGNYSFRTPALDKVAELSKKPQSCIKKLPEQLQKDANEEIDTDNLTVTVINKNFSRTFRVYCSQCKLICGIVWFTTIIPQDPLRNICFQCYTHLVQEQAKLYIKVDILKKMEISKEAKPNNKTTWGLDDNIKLLDFMANCQGKSWNDLSGQFDLNKKSLQDIIIQFMQFPIANFDPKAHQSQLKHSQIDYTQQEHVQMLEDLYDQSAYSIKCEQKEEEESKIDSRQTQNHFQAYSNLILNKYISKIDFLLQQESILEKTNLNINEQMLCNRIRYTKIMEDVKADVKEQSDDLNGYNDD